VRGTVTSKDGLHKSSLVLKELKESRVSLMILKYIDVSPTNLENLASECEDLIAIVATLIKNQQKKNGLAPFAVEVAVAIAVLLILPPILPECHQVFPFSLF